MNSTPHSAGAQAWPARRGLGRAIRPQVAALAGRLLPNEMEEAPACRHTAATPGPSRRYPPIPLRRHPTGSSPQGRPGEVCASRHWSAGHRTPISGRTCGAPQPGRYVAAETGSCGGPRRPARKGASTAGLSMRTGPRRVCCRPARPAGPPTGVGRGAGFDASDWGLSGARRCAEPHPGPRAPDRMRRALLRATPRPGPHPVCRDQVHLSKERRPLFVN